MSDARKDWDFKPAYFLMAGRIIGFGATFFIPIVLARLFTQDTFGTYRQLFLIFATLFAFAQLGMAESLYYFLPESEKKGGKYLANSFLTLFVAGLGCVGLVVVGGEWLALGMNNERLSAYLPFIGTYLLLMLVAAPLEIMWISQKRHGFAAGAYALSDVARAVLLLGFAYLFGGLRGLLIGAVVHGIMRAVIALLAGFRSYDTGMKPSGSVMREQMTYTVPFQGAIVLEVLQNKLHQFVVSYSFSTATFAIYSVGCLQIPLVDFLATAGGNVLMVGMRRASKDDDLDGAKMIWFDTTKKIALIVVFLTALLLVTSQDLIVFLFTSSYSGSVPVFMIWVLTMPMAALQTDAVLRVFAQTKFLLVQNLVRLLVVVVFIFPLMDLMGILGAVFVTVLATAVAKLLALHRMMSLLQLRISTLLPWKDLGLIVAGAMASSLPAMVVAAGLQGPIWIRLAMTSLVFVLSAGLIIWRLDIADEDLVDKAISIYRRITPERVQPVLEKKATTSKI